MAAIDSPCIQISCAFTGETSCPLVPKEYYGRWSTKAEISAIRLVAYDPRVGRYLELEASIERTKACVRRVLLFSKQNAQSLNPKTEFIRISPSVARNLQVVVVRSVQNGSVFDSTEIRAPDNCFRNVTEGMNYVLEIWHWNGTLGVQLVAQDSNNKIRVKLPSQPPAAGPTSQPPAAGPMDVDDAVDEETAKALETLAQKDESIIDEWIKKERDKLLATPLYADPFATPPRTHPFLPTNEDVEMPDGQEIQEDPRVKEEREKRLECIAGAYANDPGLPYVDINALLSLSEILKEKLELAKKLLNGTLHLGLNEDGYSFCMNRQCEINLALIKLKIAIERRNPSLKRGVLQ